MVHNMNKRHIFVLILVFSIGIVLGSVSTYYVNKRQVEYNMMTVGMCINDTSPNNYTAKLYGAAFGDFIMVRTYGRTISDVLETCTHEYAHNNLGLKDG